MSNYEFQSALYATKHAMLDAVACDWLTAGGANDALFVLRELTTGTSHGLAVECIRGWGLDLPSEPRAWQRPEDSLSHMTMHDYVDEDLILAFDRLYDQWVKPVANLPRDLQAAYVSWCLSDDQPWVETRILDGEFPVTCIYSTTANRAAIGLSGSGGGDCMWTDCASVDDAFRRYATGEAA
jgi:hypothetical protein